MRLFVAIAIPAHVKEVLRNATSHLASLLPEAQVSWTKQDNLHLTIRFLGNVEVATFAGLCQVLGDAAALVPPLQLRCEGLGVFPAIHRPRVVWAGIQENSGQLFALAKTIAHATRSFSNEPVEEHFAAHVTLGRIRRISRAGTHLLERQLEATSGQAWGSWTARGVELIESELQPGGSRYQTRHAAPFANG